MEQSKVDFGRLSEIKSFKENIFLEKQDRLSKIKKTIKFGIDFLDDALSGIHSGDILVIGAKTGVGKTELVSNIAANATRQGKKVFFFALEAEKYEIERRLKYKLFSRHIYELNRHSFSSKKINYQNWYIGNINPEYQSYEAEIEEQLAAEFGGLHVFYREFGEYTIEDFEKQFMAVKTQADLVIVDHLHYFDFDDTNENRAQKQIVKRCRDLALISGVPVIIVSHLRKPERKVTNIVLGNEEFHGTSDIGKIATKTILISPAYTIDTDKKYLWPTHFQIAKNRTDSSSTRYLASLLYNSETNEYSPTYQLQKITGAIEEFSPIKNIEEMPSWAVRGVIG